ncbi:MAG: hypothetical protein R3202_13600 [Candidatus Competibacterales bacterium]|nr:hypothetical protein [Candidatus Competibacterales bacterium]
MQAIIVSEIHANRNQVCAFVAGSQRLATAYRQLRGQWLLKLPAQKQPLACADFDTARSHVQRSIPGQAIVFERRTIVPRHHDHGHPKTSSARRLQRLENFFVTPR